MLTHCLGYPRLGPNREYKRTVEGYWQGDLTLEALDTARLDLIRQRIDAQVAAGLDLVTVGDFSWYDPLADWGLSLGYVPARHHDNSLNRDDQLFFMARGVRWDGAAAPALRLRKWFDTNYHYLVPELERGPVRPLDISPLLAELAEARASGRTVKVVIPGPLTFLWLSDAGAGAEPLDHLPVLIERYRQALAELAEAGADWIQLDEPAFALDLPVTWISQAEAVYHGLQRHDVKLMLAVSYGAPTLPLSTLAALPVAALHVDGLADPAAAEVLAERLPPHRALSIGLISGRAVWRGDLNTLTARYATLARRLGDRLLIGTTTSLQHVPWDLASEQALAADVCAKLAFARQKLDELVTLRALLRDAPEGLAAPAGGQTVSPPAETELTRAESRESRIVRQRQALGLPLLPTTTIGSFPQTAELRRARAQWRKGELDEAGYQQVIDRYLQECIRIQEEAGVDVLVHGEPERTDMVEFFAEFIDGMVTTTYGWVQSYGSRCVKPPIIVGDLSRRQPMTVAIFRRAQALTSRPVKGMLTGPVTLLNWSFVRQDIPREAVAYQLARCVREEVADLEAAGARIIQVDEPALREGLPLRQSQHADYLRWATRAFRLATAVAGPDTQIHTHMCYATFGDILDAIVALDADVITLETSRAQGELVRHLARHPYPADIGPGVWDVHSPAVPDTDQLVAFIERLLTVIPAERLWINPDCGLKTRNWEEVVPSLHHMVEAARRVREARSAKAARKADEAVH
ncbi:MAG: 5-methyltetrahydropteroyltriglutamate--homocysteine S-methyltransferase [Gammaproteobacteria bacterium]|nr:MAG: 5-methyltetrahydropteroyltriglutamate--homocysteine S-methyltransferase [Gammaproteobacteria bacterium]